MQRRSNAAGLLPRAAIGQSLPADLARLRPLRRIAGWVTFDPHAADALTAVVSEFANMILLLDVTLLLLASRHIRAHGKALVRTFAAVGTLDVAAAEATLAELIDGDGDTPSSHIVIAATHDRELVELMPRTCTAYHFSDRIEADELVFDYRLRKGPARTWNAIALLEICGAPPRLVERARARTVGLTDQRRLGRNHA